MGAVLFWLGPPGTDLAAHVYQRQLFLNHGFALWNNFWYAGRYSFVGYSLLYYPVAALVGIKLLGLLSVNDRCGRVRGRLRAGMGEAARWPARVFAVVVAVSVVSGAFPYLLGFAFALVALAALQSRRTTLFAVVAVATFAASPLAFLLLVVVLAAAAMRSRRLLAAPAVAVGCTCLAAVALWRVFPAAAGFRSRSRSWQPRSCSAGSASRSRGISRAPGCCSRCS